MKKHIKKLTDLQACKNGIRWASKFDSFYQSWNTCTKPEWMLWMYDVNVISISERDLRLFTCDCIKYTRLKNGKSIYEYALGENGKYAVYVAELYAHNKASLDDLRIASDNAWKESFEIRNDPIYGMLPIKALFASYYATRESGRSAAAYAYLPYHADLLRKRIGNPFVEVEA